VHKLHNSILRDAACVEHRKAIFYTENLQKIKFRHISRRYPTRLRQFDFKQKNTARKHGLSAIRFLRLAK
jgi:hypothetical protein